MSARRRRSRLPISRANDAAVSGRCLCRTRWAAFPGLSHLRNRRSHIAIEPPQAVRLGILQAAANLWGSKRVCGLRRGASGGRWCRRSIRAQRTAGSSEMSFQVRTAAARRAPAGRSAAAARRRSGRGRHRRCGPPRSWSSRWCCHSRYPPAARCRRRSIRAPRN